MSARIEMSGKVFGRWTVLSYAGDRRWLCRCECGAEKAIDGKSLRKGESRGCIKCHTVNGTRTTHGGSDHRLYNIWCGMKRRCENPNDEAYDNYGGRGIVVCTKWREDFVVFRDWALSNGYSDDLTIDREDNDGGYDPGNCRWATYSQQAKNRRCTVFVEYQGERVALVDLADRTGVSYDLLKQRICRRGWPVDRAVSEPSRGNWRSQ